MLIVGIRFFWVAVYLAVDISRKSHNFVVLYLLVTVCKYEEYLSQLQRFYVKII